MTPHELPFYTYMWKECTESEDWEARCLEIPDLSAYGETPEEAQAEIKIAVCGWLEVLKQDGLHFPDPLNVLHAGQVAIEDDISEPIDSRVMLGVAMNQSLPTGSFSSARVPIQVG